MSVNEDRRKEGGKEGGNKSHSRTFYPTILAISITNCFFLLPAPKSFTEGFGTNTPTSRSEFRGKKRREGIRHPMSLAGAPGGSFGGAIRDRTGQRRVDSRGPSDAA